MRNLKIFTHCTLLATIPSLLAYPQNNLPRVTSQVVHYEYQQDTQAWVHPTTYDEIMSMLEDLESGEAEKKYSLLQLQQVNEYLVILAKEGILPDEFEEELALEEDVEDLMHGGEDSLFQLASSFGTKNEYMIVPAVFNGYSNYDIIQCGKISKAWKKTKNFVKKHKKEIIIGAVVVIAVAVVAVAVVAASSATAATAAAGAAGAAASSGSGSGSGKSGSSESESNDDSSPVSSVPKESDPSVAATNEAPLLKAALDEQVSSFKEFMVEDKIAGQALPSQGWDDLSFGEKARELGANLAHKAFDEVTDLAKVVPQLCEEVKEIGSKLLPERPILPNDGSTGCPIENYEHLVAKGHQAIDSVFSTDQAELFAAEAKANDLMNNFAIGIIPLPGMISSNGTINVKEFSKLGRVPDRAEYTKAGRGSMKHGYREGRTVFEKPVGNPAQINEHGQKVLDEILNHPEKKVVQYTHKIHGPVIDIEAPEIGGVRFTGDGKEMMGFLEPKWFKQ